MQFVKTKNNFSVGVRLMMTVLREGDRRPSVGSPVEEDLAEEPIRGMAPARTDSNRGVGKSMEIEQNDDVFRKLCFFVKVIEPRMVREISFFKLLYRNSKSN